MLLFSTWFITAQNYTVSEAIGSTFDIPFIIPSIIYVLAIYVVIIGGVKKVGKIASYMVPCMCAFYVVGCVFILIKNAGAIPGAFALIFKGAFTAQAAAGGFLGATVATAMRLGFARSVYSNEAGWGTSPMIHASAKTDHPVKQGIFGVFEVFMDTIVVCTMTALVVLLGVGVQNIEYGTDIGANLTIMGFESVFGGGIPSVAVAICLTLFALSTVLTWALYGSRCVEYLFGYNASKVYQVIFCLFACIAGAVELELAWAIADTLNGLMAIPNLVALALLSPTVIKLSKEYFSSIKKK